MATIGTRATFYRTGQAPVGECIGYEAGPARVSWARYEFTSPAVGASSISWRSTTCGLTQYYYNDGSGAGLAWGYLGNFNWNITTDPNGFNNYIGDGGYDVGARGGEAFWSNGSVSVNLLPNTTYYIFVYPDSRFRNMYAIFTIGGMTVTTSGSYGITPILATNANIGENSTITLSPYSSEFEHDVSYKITGQDSYTSIAEGTKSTSIIWEVPTSVYSYLPSTDRTINIELKCVTYREEVTIGESTATITVYAVEDVCKPLLADYWVATNSSSPYTGDDRTIITNWSNITVSIEGTPRNGATISSYSIINNGVTYNGSSHSFEQIEVPTFVCRVVDSRGYATEHTINISYVHYFKPTILIEATAPNPQTNIATVKAKGKYFNDNFGAVDNTLDIQYRVKQQYGEYGDWQTLTSSAEDNDYETVRQNIELDYHNTYIFQCRVIDTLNNILSEEITVVALPVFDWGKNDFHFNVPIIFSTASYGDTLPQYGQEGQVFIKI